jgi:hypothetical protein
MDNKERSRGGTEEKNEKEERKEEEEKRKHFKLTRKYRGPYLSLNLLNLEQAKPSHRYH